MPTTKWTCPGCGTQIPGGNEDIVIDHVSGCELVDGAGAALQGRPLGLVALRRLGVLDLPAETERFVLLNDVTGGLGVGEGLQLSFVSSHPTEHEALDTIVYDRINALPRLLIDLEAESNEISVLNYHPIVGMTQLCGYNLALDPDDIEQLRTELLDALEEEQ